MRDLAAVWAVVVTSAAPALGQDVLGPGRCVGCHAHAEPSRKWQIEEPARLGGRAHFGSLGRLEDRRAPAFAQAIGLKSAYATDGACVRCHATLFRGRANAGVSCESCHGPSRGWIELHQEKGSHQRSVAAGLRDLAERPDAIARLCVSCHAVEDGRLVEAGHSSGASFDAGASLRQIVHWTTHYDDARVTAAGRAAMPRLPSAPLRAGGPPAPAGTTGTTSGTPPAGSDRWDTARPLPPAYVPEPAPDLENPVEPPAAVTTALRASLPVASVAEDVAPLSPSPLRKAAPAAVALPVNPRLEVRNQSLLLLARLLASGVRLPAGAPPPDPAEHPGPDGELLRIQDEVHALALLALRRPRP